jgi:2,3-dihydro-2,3-dihydroxybenzoate dehydrogenase
MEPIELTGRVALITGAAQGIGAAVCTTLAKHGAVVAAVDANCEALDAFVKTLQNNGNNATGYALDVTEHAAVDGVVEEIERDLGAIDILVNVAGVLRTGPILDVTDEDWSTVLAVNVSGVFNLCRAVGRRMVPRRSGRIVTVASNAAGVPRMGMGVYGASKAASGMLTRTLGLELARHGIRCNVVSPGSTDTPMLRAMWTDPDAQSATVDGSLPMYRVGIPLGKLATPADVADAVLFLVSDRAGHITMHDLYVDGGAALRG